MSDPSHGDRPPMARGRCEAAARALDRLLVEILRPGWHGSAAIEMTIVDGVIQSIRERQDKAIRPERATHGT